MNSEPSITSGSHAAQSVGKPIDVGLADSNPLMLGALSEVIDRDTRFGLVATARTAESFLEIVLRADLAVGIVDWTLPTLGCEKLLEIVRAQTGGPRLVVYSHDPNTDIARRAMAAGAAGFCSRGEAPERLLDIVAEVAAGHMVFPFLDVRDLKRDPLDTLTDRERILLGLLARGSSNRDLARELDISVNTVKFHLRNLYEKLSVRSRGQAIALYFTSGPGAKEAQVANQGRLSND
ncbi:MAG: response regulator transcription factor [Pseudomonadota bacterium]